MLALLGSAVGAGVFAASAQVGSSCAALQITGDLTVDQLHLSDAMARDGRLVGYQDDRRAEISCKGKKRG